MVRKSSDELVRRGAGPSRGRPRNPAANAAILRAVIELISERGLEAATVHEIARRAGVARATIYLRWPGHDALIAAALRHAIGREPYPLTGDIETDLRRGAEQARAVLSAPLLRAVLPALIRELLATGQRYESVKYDALFPNRGRYAAAYRRNAAAQGLRADLDGEVVVDLLMGAHLNQFLATGSPPTDAFARQTVDVILAGLRKPTGS